jgi:hypothetical protein
VQLIAETIKDVKARIDVHKQAMDLQDIEFGLDTFDGSKQIISIIEEIVK